MARENDRRVTTMWTERKGSITEPNALVEYVNNIEQFHDYIVGSFTYNSQSATLSLTIEEDCLGQDHTNAPALIWDLKCQGVTDFRMDDMDGLSRWWIYELLYDGEVFQFQLVNGYFAFQASNFTFGIPCNPSISDE